MTRTLGLASAWTGFLVPFVTDLVLWECMVTIVHTLAVAKMEEPVIMNSDNVLVCQALRAFIVKSHVPEEHGA